jgi:hypothetical protein
MDKILSAQKNKQNVKISTMKYSGLLLSFTGCDCNWVREIRVATDSGSAQSMCWHLENINHKV